MSEITYAGMMPVLALRGLAVFPEQTVHFDVGRTKSALALEAAMKKDQVLLLVPQKDLLVDDPKLADLYPVGTVVRVKQLLNAPDENLRVLVTGVADCTSGFSQPSMDTEADRDTGHSSRNSTTPQRA